MIERNSSAALLKSYSVWMFRLHSMKVKGCSLPGLCFLLGLLFFGWVYWFLVHLQNFFFFLLASSLIPLISICFMYIFFFHVYFLSLITQYE